MDIIRPHQDTSERVDQTVTSMIGLSPVVLADGLDAGNCDTSFDPRVRDADFAKRGERVHPVVQVGAPDARDIRDQPMNAGINPQDARLGFGLNYHRERHRGAYRDALDEKNRDTVKEWTGKNQPD